MDETRHFGLPLLASGQAQKHVTVNEALARLDALASGIVESASLTVPPLAGDGEVYIVPIGAGQAWGAADGVMAVFLNGGWVHAAPIEGRIVWVRDTGEALRFTDGLWGPVETAPMPMVGEIRVDLALAGGSSVATDAIVPAGTVILGLSARVLDAVTGVAGWSLGVPEAGARYGRGHPVAVGATAIGVTGAPIAYPDATGFVVTAEGGSFTGGIIRLCAHCLTLVPPDA